MCLREIFSTDFTGFVGNKFGKFNPLRWIFWKDAFETIKFYLFLKNKKPHFVGHNPLALLSYWIFNYLGSLIVIFTGFFMYFEPQKHTIWAKLFAWVPYIFGGDSFTIRSWHHLAAWASCYLLSSMSIWLSVMTILNAVAPFLPCLRDIKQNLKKQLVKKMIKNDNNQKITILGIGNTLFSDEGVGIHLLPILEEALKDDENIEIIEGLTDGMRLLGPVEDAENLIIIDAINAGKEGGTIISLEGEEIPAYFGIKMSIHQLGFQEVLLAAKMRERYPKKIMMFGMQPTSLELGVELTETNREQLDDLTKAVINQVKRWRAAHET